MDAEVGRLALAALLSFAGGAVLALWLERIRTKRGAAARIRALRREVDENIGRIGPLDGTVRGFPRRIECRAYDAADDLILPRSAAAALASAYVEGAEVNDRIELVNANLTAAGGAIDSTTNAGQQAIHHQRALGDQAVAAGKPARAAFENARDELAKLGAR